MQVLRLIRFTGFFISIAAFLAIGHEYHKAMTAPAESSARFVSSSGESRSPGQEPPSFIDSATILIAGLFGKETKPQTGLAALNTRNRTSQLSYDDRAMREMDFWMNFTSKLGFSGP